MSNQIDKRVIVIVGFLAVLILIVKPLWDAREQWQFGEGRDDAVYFVTAKSIASGQGYRQENLPGRPYLTKYPPMFPLLMSIAWRITPQFPKTLETASLLQACLLPVYLALLLGVLGQLGFSWRRSLLIAGLTFVSFGFLLLAATLYSEILFGCFLLASIFLIERSAASNSARLMLLAGFLAGLAYLTRNAAIPLFAAVPIFLFLRKKLRLTIPFFVTALPMAAAWHAWAFLHPGAAKTSYVAEFLSMVRGHDLVSHLLEQAATLSAGIAESFFPGLMEFLHGIPLHHLVLIAAISGAIRLGKRREWPVLLIFGALYLIMILLWTFEGLDRLMVPAWPMIVVGIAEEASHFANILAQSSKNKHLPRWALIAAGLLIVLRNDSVNSHRLDQVIADEREARRTDIAAYQWIAQHASKNTVALAWKDCLLYLYSGVPASHDLFVAEIPDSEVIPARRLPFTRPADFDHAMLVLLESDLGRDPSKNLQNSFRATAAAVSQSTLEYNSPGASIYRFPIP